MLRGDYSELIHRVNRLSECTDEVIRLIPRLIDVVLALLDDNGRIQADIDTYNNDICILEDVLRTNEILREIAEAYMCCFSAPGLMSILWTKKSKIYAAFLSSSSSFCWGVL